VTRLIRFERGEVDEEGVAKSYQEEKSRLCGLIKFYLNTFIFIRVCANGKSKL
jgi:hypothetical protein